MTETIIRLLLRLSEEGADAFLTGAEARPHYGPLFDRLLRRQVLCEEAPLSEWAVCSGCECGVPARLLEQEGGRCRARCPSDHTRDVVLAPDDLRSFTIDLVAFARLIAEAAGFDGSIEAIVPGVWSLGQLSPRRVLAACFDRRALEQPHLASALTRNGRQEMTLLGPRPSPQLRELLRMAGVDCREFDDVVSTDADSRVRMSRHLLDPGGSARMVLDTRDSSVLIDGIPQRVPPQPFRLLTFLATAALDGKGKVARSTIEREFSREPRDLVRDLRKSLSKDRDNAEEILGWIVSVRASGAFELILPSDEIEVHRA